MVNFYQAFQAVLFSMLCICNYSSYKQLRWPQKRAMYDLLFDVCYVVYLFACFSLAKLIVLALFLFVSMFYFPLSASCTENEKMIY